MTLIFDRFDKAEGVGYFTKTAIFSRGELNGAGNHYESKEEEEISIKARSPIRRERSRKPREPHSDALGNSEASRRFE